MNKLEYEKIKKLSYLEYCEYLQNKYGLAKGPYFNTNFGKNSTITRTKDGLVIHHKFEDHAILLGEVAYASKNPYEWQKPENLVYCDYLEHLLLHVLICENPSPDRNKGEAVGIGGVVNFIAPELNDLYSGWVTKQPWRLTCHNKVIEDKDVYLEIIKRFKHNCYNYPLYNEEDLYSSFNEKYFLWKSEFNESLYNEMRKL